MNVNYQPSNVKVSEPMVGTLIQLQDGTQDSVWFFYPIVENGTYQSANLNFIRETQCQVD